MLDGKNDFRSDTITQPTEEMREAMHKARVGDDGRGEDPTVRELEEYSATLLGKEAGLFVVSGTAGNLISLMAHTTPGQELILEKDAHIYYFEVGGMARVAGLVINQVVGKDGVMAPKDVEAAIRVANPSFPVTGLISIENTHNIAGGMVHTAPQMAAIKAVAERHGIPVHLDGARIFNAAVALGIPARDLVAHADTLTFCLSKGLSAPVGSVILGPKKFIDTCRRMRKMLGGTMRQAGVIAAAGLVAVKTMIDRLAEDHRNARRLAEKLSKIEGLMVDTTKVQTNIVRSKTTGLGVAAAKVAAMLAEHNVHVYAQQADTLRWVLHRHVTPTDVDEAAAAVAKVAKALRG